jgi:hypothetical protein
MAELKHLISPFVTHSHAHTLHLPNKVMPRPMTPCNCDSDDEMAPECAFICALSARSHTTSKKRNTGKGHRAKKTRRNKKKYIDTTLKN